MVTTNNTIIYEIGCRISYRDGDVTISYSLVSTDDGQNKCYSVLCLLNDKEAVESKFIYDISRDEAEGKELVDMLCRCEVLPFSLCETVCEYISEKYSV